jgi:hypothetical protein
LSWTLIFFLAGHLGIGLYLYHRHSDLFDPEVTLRLRMLPERLAESPGRPLALAVGSSRLVLGLRPVSVMDQVTDEPKKAILFNFSMLGAGPMSQRLVLHRLLRKGIRPKWLFVEMWPPLLTQEAALSEENRTFEHDVYWSDVPILGRLYHRRWEAVGRVIAETLAPLLQYRQTVLERYAPSMLPLVLRQLCEGSFEKSLQHRLDDFGWVDYELRADPVHGERARRVYKPQFDAFAMSDVSDRALCAMLAECRAHGIRVVFLLMPDHSIVRGWYASMQRRYIPYLRRLSAENNAPIVDARDWLPDEAIPDCTHLSPKGARAFSERFGREVYCPLLQGRQLSGDVLLRDP